MNRSTFGRLFSAAALVIAGAACQPALAGPFPGGLFVFGDSLSDSGNNKLAGAYDPTQVVTGNTYIPSNTYASGVYSNGPVWASYFASMLGTPLVPSLTPGGGNNFASGGATTGTPGSFAGGYPFDLLVQAGQYLGATHGVASPDALYVVAGGGNNARAALQAIAGGADINATIATAAASFASDIDTIVDELHAAGARHVIVWDVPNVGLAPAIAAGGPQASFLGTSLAAAMNGALAQVLAGDGDVMTFDLYGLGSTIAANPGAFGFANVTDACGAIAAANCSTYAYWDGIHPTTALHESIAEAMYALAVPEPETYALLILGLAAVAIQGRRRAAPQRATVSAS